MPAEPSFEELLARVRQRDERAATELVRQYEPEVRRFVHYRLNSPRLRRLLDSVDVCQSVFANFFVRIADGRFDLESPRQLQRLLLTMADNKLTDHVRKQSAARRHSETALAETIDAVADSHPAPGSALETRDLVEVVVARLSPEERGLVDQWLDGRDWPEIASVVGTTPEAVRKRFTRALDRVAREMGWEEQQ